MVELVKMLSQPTGMSGWPEMTTNHSRVPGARSDIFVSFGKECGANAKTITMTTTTAPRKYHQGGE